MAALSRYREEYDILLEGIANLYIARASAESKADISYLKPLIKDMVSLTLSLMENKDVIKRLRGIRAQRRKGGKDIDIVYIINSPDSDINTLFKNFAKGL